MEELKQKIEEIINETASTINFYVVEYHDSTSEKMEEDIKGLKEEFSKAIAEFIEQNYIPKPKPEADKVIKSVW